MMQKFSELTTMAVGGNIGTLLSAHTSEEVAEICQKAKDKKLFVLGGGSNTLARDIDFEGIVLKNEIKGIECIEDTPEKSIFKIGAGENWDDFVALAVQKNLTGIEAMSKIPGTVGAAPVQNIGAYGQELAEVFVALTAYDRHADVFVVLDAADCDFSYRHSIFRGSEAGRYVICDVTLCLSKSAPQPPFYAPIAVYIEAHPQEAITPAKIRKIVSDIREDKLPDPATHPNSGSFFKNAIVAKDVYLQLAVRYPDVPHYPVDETHEKIPTGWLIEQAGFRGVVFDELRMRVNDKNALVLINNGTTQYADVAAARDRIIMGVHEKFGIVIEQEPLEV